MTIKQTLTAVKNAQNHSFDFETGSVSRERDDNVHYKRNFNEVLGFAWPNADGTITSEAYLWKDYTDEDKALLKEIMESEKCKKVAANIKFDAKQMVNELGGEIKGVAFDTTTAWKLAVDETKGHASLEWIVNNWLCKQPGFEGASIKHPLPYNWGKDIHKTKHKKVKVTLWDFSDGHLVHSIVTNGGKIISCPGNLADRWLGEKLSELKSWFKIKKFKTVCLKIDELENIEVTRVTASIKWTPVRIKRIIEGIVPKKKSRYFGKRNRVFAHYGMFLEILRKHCKEDCYYELVLAYQLKPLIVKYKMARLFEEEMGNTREFIKAELRGIPFNVKKAIKLREDYLPVAEKYRKEMAKLTNTPGIKDSDKMLAPFFEKKIKDKTKKGLPSLKADNLKALRDEGDELATAILNFRHWDKYAQHIQSLVDNTYDGRIFPIFNTCGTETGRQKCSNPNIQQVPKKSDEGAKIRALFEGNFLIFDLSQIELRLWAHHSQDPQWLKVFREGKIDPHEATGRELAKKLGEKYVKETHREPAKQLNYKALYSLNNDWFDMYPVSQIYRDSLVGQWVYVPMTSRDGKYNWMGRSHKTFQGSLYEKGYTETLLGRRRRFPDYKFAIDNGENTKFHKKSGKYKRLKWYAFQDEKKAVNQVPQGGCADLMKTIINMIAKILPELKLDMAVHDECMYEVAPNKYGDKVTIELIEKTVATVGEELGITVPVLADVKYGKSWKEGK